MSITKTQLNRLKITRLVTPQGITALQKSNMTSLQTRLTIRSMELGVPFSRAKNRALRAKT